MAQKSVDSRASGLENGQISSPADPKQLPVAAKKTPLRDLPNENNVAMGKSNGSSIFRKEGETEAVKVSGTKRPSSDLQPNPSHHQSPGGNSVNGHLVYVRRKPEAEVAKSTAVETTLNNAPNSTQPQQVVAPIPAASSASLSSLKPSIPHSIGKSNNRPISSESHPQPVASALPLSDQKRVNNQNWEERYVQLQMYLKKLDQSSQEEYLEKLRALPAAELSRHAVELEKRSIQLSLEEGIELKRVKALDVLGKSKKAQN